jgi:hypothetical protein
MKMDVETYKARTGSLDLAGIDFDAFWERPQSAAGQRCLRYMHDVEFHTVCYLRDLLVTSVHRDPEITTFLTFWNSEEFWHGEALAEVLRRHGEPAGDSRVSIRRAALPRKDRAAPLVHSLGSLVAGESFAAIHMTWGAINEWTTQAGYARLAARERHPVLSELLRRIMRQEGRHIDFYASQAARRLAGDRRAQRLTRFALRRFWRPVGANVMPDGELAFLARHLFSDAEGRASAARIDRHIDRLPGLHGLGLVEGAAVRYAA